MKKGYIAGSLFSEADIAQRLKEGSILRNAFPHIDWFNPIEAPFNEDKSTLPEPSEIFDGDTMQVESSDYFIADLSTNDPGVMVELGIAWANGCIIIGVLSDIRLATASQYSIPSYSMNHYVLGLFSGSNAHLVDSFENVIGIIRQYEEA